MQSFLAPIRRRRLVSREFLGQLAVFGTPIATATALAMFLFYHFDVQMVDHHLHETEHHHLYLRDVMIRQNMETALSGLRLLATLEPPQSASRAGADPAGRALAARFAAFCQEYPQYRAIRLVTSEGRQVDAVLCNASSGVAPQVLAPGSWAEPLSRLEPGESYVSSIAADAHPDRHGGAEAVPVVRMAMPFTSEAGRLVVVDVNLRRLISEMMLDTGQGGTMMLVQKDGRFVRKPNGGERWGDTVMPGRETPFGAAYPEVWRQLAAEDHGVIETDAGLFSYTTLDLARALNEHGDTAGPHAHPVIHAPVWKIVSHVPESQLHTGLDTSIRKALLLIPAPLLVALYLASLAVRRRRAAHEMEDRERYLRRIMDSVVDAIVTTDEAGRIERANAATVTLFGLESAAKLPPSVTELVPQDLLPAEAGWALGRQGGQGESRPLRAELDLERADGSVFPAECVRMVAELDVGRRLIWLIRDMSERQALEAKQNAERMRFFHQTKMAEIGLIAAGIIHEVGNPITAIAGMVSELTEEADRHAGSWSPSARETLETIASEAGRLSGITREISDYVRGRPGAEELFDLNSLVRSTARLVSYDARWKWIRLELELDPAIPAVQGVQDQLSQVLINLMVNAADAVQEREPGNRVVTVRTEGRRGGVALTVADNGVGMDPSTLTRAFESFFSTKPEGKGTGLGLSLCQSIVAAHKGTIEIQSSEQQGARIRVELPAGTGSAAMTG